MAHGPQTIAQLRAAYAGGKSLEASARELGVADSSARRWRQEAMRRGDDWLAARDGLPPVGMPAALAALERIEAAIGGFAGEGGGFLPEGWTVSGEGEVLSEADQVAAAMASLRREIRCGFAAVLIVAAAIGIWAGLGG